ncbi:tetratricopeptide repeat protein [Sphingomonas sp. LT1P40]|uniref:tetratricopeptide repeat protein n=1 Tax=Alteristakelama amylovorans TaxID=3096166 RepID=UPI002FCBE9D1
MAHVSRSLIAALSLLAAGVAHGQQQIDVKQPSAAFLAAFESGDLRKALPLIEPDTKACVAAAGGDKADKDTLAPCVMLLAYYGAGLAGADRIREALPISRKAVEVAADFGEASEISIVANLLFGLTLERQGQHGDAEQPYRISLQGAEQLLKGDPALATYIIRRASNLLMLGRFAEALPLAERAIAIAGDTADGAFFRLMQGNALMRLGRMAEAEAAFTRGIQRLTALVGADVTETLALREALALYFAEQNRADEAIAIWRRTLAIRRTRGEAADIADSLSGLGMALLRSGQSREAESVLREALDIRLKQFGEASNFTGVAYSNVGLVLMESGQLNEAASMFGRALAVLNAAGGANPEELVTVLNNFALVLAKIGMVEESVGIQRQVLAIAETNFGKGHGRTVMLRQNLGSALSAIGQKAEAIALLTANYEAGLALGGEGMQLRALAAVSLAAILAEAGKRAEARGWYVRAIADGRAAFRPDHSQRINIGWSYGTFMLREPGGLPLARTLLRDAGQAVLLRAAAGVGFDARAQSELSGFTIVFRDQVRAAWGLSAAR